MKRLIQFSAALLLSCSVAACVDGAGAESTDGDVAIDETAQAATDPNQRVYNVVEAVLPAGNYDGVAGDECVALLNPEHRLRKIILVQALAPGASCTLTQFPAGTAYSFTWGDTQVYQGTAGIAAIRSALNDGDGAVHRLIGSITSEAATWANLQGFLTLTDAQQASQLVLYSAVRVHSIYDFEGEEQVKAEAAYQAVRPTQTCENPGSPQLHARVFAGFVYGYTASNSGSCHSGWFSRLHIYNRSWRLVGKQEYSE